MMKVLVWYFVSDTHKVMPLILVVFDFVWSSWTWHSSYLESVIVEFSLQCQKYEMLFPLFKSRLGAKVPAAAYGKTESTKAAPTVGDISCFSLFITLSLLMYIYIWNWELWLFSGRNFFCMGTSEGMCKCFRFSLFRYVHPWSCQWMDVEWESGRWQWRWYAGAWRTNWLKKSNSYKTIWEWQYKRWWVRCGVGHWGCCGPWQWTSSEGKHLFQHLPRIVHWLLSLIVAPWVSHVGWSHC